MLYIKVDVNETVEVVLGGRTLRIVFRGTRGRRANLGFEAPEDVRITRLKHEARWPLAGRSE